MTFVIWKFIFAQPEWQLKATSNYVNTFTIMSFHTFTEWHCLVLYMLIWITLERLPECVQHFPLHDWINQHHAFVVPLVSYEFRWTRKSQCCVFSFTLVFWRVHLVFLISQLPHIAINIVALIVGRIIGLVTFEQFRRHHSYLKEEGTV